MWHQVICEDRLLAIIVKKEYQCVGAHFFTPDHFSQQLGYMRHPRGHVIKPHTHRLVPREVSNTLEVLFIRKGRLQVDFYDDNREFFRSEILNAGDVLLLAAGGHGFTALEDLEMFEVKQGPYVGLEDKLWFNNDLENR